MNTNISNNFFRLFNKHFRPDHKLRENFHKNTLKCSFSYMLKMKTKSDGHTIKGTSQNKLHSESLKFTHWFKKNMHFFEIKTTAIPEYLFDFIPQTKFPPKIKSCNCLKKDNCLMGGTCLTENILYYVKISCDDEK